MKMRLIIFGFLVFGFAVIGSAQTETPQIRKKQIKQQKRIAEGARTGELTGKEVVYLEKQQAKINHTKKKAKADGVVTRKERAKIYAKQAHLSRQICLKKNNDLTR